MCRKILANLDEDVKSFLAIALFINKSISELQNHYFTEEVKEILNFFTDISIPGMISAFHIDTINLYTILVDHCICRSFISHFEAFKDFIENCIKDLMKQGLSIDTFHLFYNAAINNPNLLETLVDSQINTNHNFINHLNFIKEMYPFNFLIRKIKDFNIYFLHPQYIREFQSLLSYPLPELNEENISKYARISFLVVNTLNNAMIVELESIQISENYSNIDFEKSQDKELLEFCYLNLTAIRECMESFLERLSNWIKICDFDNIPKISLQPYYALLKHYLYNLRQINARLEIFFDLSDIQAKGNMLMKKK